MAKQSGYLQRREAELDATFNAGAAMAGWGYDRIMRITHNWVAVQREGRADPVPRAVSQYKEDQIREVRYG